MVDQSKFDRIVWEKELENESRWLNDEKKGPNDLNLMSK